MNGLDGSKPDGPLQDDRFVGRDRLDRVESFQSALGDVGVDSGHFRRQSRSMKHDQLCAIGHNVADSLAFGAWFVIDDRWIDVFGEAGSQPNGSIEVDVLTGHLTQGLGSHELRQAVRRVANSFPRFCERHGGRSDEFAVLLARFEGPPPGRRLTLTVEDRTGRRSVTQYEGQPLGRSKHLDQLGRLRRRPRTRYLASPRMSDS